jgi:hypothetical protein
VTRLNAAACDADSEEGYARCFRRICYAELLVGTAWHQKHHSAAKVVPPNSVIVCVIRRLWSSSPHRGNLWAPYLC